jgi:hypothetical protein
MGTPLNLIAAILERPLIVRLLHPFEFLGYVSKPLAIVGVPRKLQLIREIAALSVIPYPIRVLELPQDFVISHVLSSPSGRHVL